MATAAASKQRTAVRMVQLRGDLDAAAATSAFTRLLQLDLRPGQRLILDLRELTFMDSTGVRVLLKAMEQAHRAGAAFSIVAGPPPVMRVLDLVGLRDQLDVLDGA
jgi:anti-sigma B factor antagonist